LGLADELAEMGIQRVVVESTSDYWRVFFYLLEARGLVVWLVNARDVKNVPGRPKTDKLDAVWLAKLNERGMLRPSFVPPKEIRQLRDYTRLRAELTEERSRHKQRIEKLLEDSLIKLSTVATDIFGQSGRAMLEALIAGERDPGLPPTNRTTFTQLLECPKTPRTPSVTCSQWSCEVVHHCTK
jgi:transposase